MSENKQILRCGNCGTKNRISLNKELTPICGKCKQQLKFPTEPLIITDANFNELVEGSSMPFLLDFWATWCPPCRMLAPIVDEIANELSGKAMIGKLDVDGNQLTAGKFQVRSIPTMIIFKDGREAERIVGLQTKEAIVQKLSKFI